MAAILGIDFGTKRIGLASGDDEHGMAFPLETVPAQPPKAALARIRAVVAEKNIAKIVIGQPVRADGADGTLAATIRVFADKVRAATRCPVVEWDERFSTSMAEQVLIDADMRREDRRQVVDQLAAQIMLQSWLDAQAGSPPGPNPDDRDE